MNKSEINKAQEKRTPKARRALLAAVLAGGTAFTALVLSDGGGEKVQTNEAETGFFNEEQQPSREGVLVLREGVRVRTTPERTGTRGGQNAPEITDSVKNIDFVVESGQNVVVTNPYVVEDELGRQWYGFTMLGRETDDHTTDAEATLWVDFTTLKETGDATFTDMKVAHDPVTDNVEAVGSVVDESNLEHYIDALEFGLVKPQG